MPALEAEAMTADLTIARNEIHDAFRDAWFANAPAVNGGVVPPIAYDNMPIDRLEVEAWARITIRHSGGNQRTFIGDENKAWFEKRGLVVVSIFTPVEDMRDTTLAEALAKVAQAAFEFKETPNQIEFEGVFSAEVGQSDDEDAGMAWYQINVQASFKYDEAVSIS